MLACHRSAVERRRRTKGAFEAAPTSNFISNWFGNSTKTQERLRATHAATNDSRR
ncbi:hypothetical protein HanRHA438_Chr09g0410981 [Helianthus annuus]|uniref:Uncharacterized protein n=1 Tax=Helianthus annuus TaxID=4232 RepID=A0A251TXN1_HELAN|nr:hypothetical protein HanRHA438_Chr09g0410981 [Helianthus annuus]